MKHLLIMLGIMLLPSCCTIAQIPNQYVYIDINCNATLPSYLEMFIVSDNCEIFSIAQLPDAGTLISTTTDVEIFAIDVSGTESSVNFSVVILDTIPPTIMLDPTWTGYSDEVVGDMYRTVFGWVQIKGVAFNEVLPFEEYPASMIDSMKVFTCTIPIPAVRHREWWWAVDYPQ